MGRYVVTLTEAQHQGLARLLGHMLAKDERDERDRDEDLAVNGPNVNVLRGALTALSNAERKEKGEG